MRRNVVANDTAKPHSRPQNRPRSTARDAVIESQFFPSRFQSSGVMLAALESTTNHAALTRVRVTNRLTEMVITLAQPLDKKDVFTCLNWGRISSTENATNKTKTKKMRKATTSEHPLLLVGCLSGNLQALDFAENPPQSVLYSVNEKGALSAINDCVIHDHHAYTCSENGTIGIWDLGEKKLARSFATTLKSPKKINIIAKEGLVVLGGKNGELQLWSLSEGTLIKVIKSNHASPVSLLEVELAEFSTDRYLLASGASEDRSITISTISFENKAEVTSHTLLTWEEAFTSHAEWNSDQLLVLSESGMVIVWKPEMSKLPLVIQLKNNKDKQNVPVWAASWLDQYQIYVAYGTRFKPSFALLDLNQFWALKNLNAPIEHWITLNKSLLLDESENLNKKLKESSNKPHKTPLIDVDREMPRVGADLKEESFSERLALKPAENEERPILMKHHGMTPKPTSILRVLTQALSTNDPQLLQSCFDHGDVVLLQNSVAGLPSNLVIKLFNELLVRFRRQPQRAVHYAKWIKVMLLCHAVQLSSSASSVQTRSLLQTLSAGVDRRTKHQMELRKVLGKLDMVLGMTQKGQRQPDNYSSGQALEDKPRAVYIEADERLILHDLEENFANSTLGEGLDDDDDDDVGKDNAVKNSIGEGDDDDDDDDKEEDESGDDSEEDDDDDDDDVDEEDDEGEESSENGEEGEADIAMSHDLDTEVKEEEDDDEEDDDDDEEVDEMEQD